MYQLISNNQAGNEKQLPVKALGHLVKINSRGKKNHSEASDRTTNAHEKHFKMGLKMKLLCSGLRHFWQFFYSCFCFELQYFISAGTGSECSMEGHTCLQGREQGAGSFPSHPQHLCCCQGFSPWPWDTFCALEGQEREKSSVGNYISPTPRARAVFTRPGCYKTVSGGRMNIWEFLACKGSFSCKNDPSSCLCEHHGGQLCVLCVSIHEGNAHWATSAS